MEWMIYNAHGVDDIHADGVIGDEGTPSHRFAELSRKASLLRGWLPSPVGEGIEDADADLRRKEYNGWGCGHLIHRKRSPFSHWRRLKGR